MLLEVAANKGAVSYTALELFAEAYEVGVRLRLLSFSSIT